MLKNINKQQVSKFGRLFKFLSNKIRKYWLQYDSNKSFQRNINVFFPFIDTFYYMLCTFGRILTNFIFVLCCCLFVIHRNIILSHWCLKTCRINHYYINWFLNSKSLEKSIKCKF